MNTIFAFIFLVSAATLCFISPESFLPSLMSGAHGALALLVQLAVVYAVWLGLLNVMKDAGMTQGMSRLLKPLNARLFGVRDEETGGYICMNLSANLLGMGGVATPAGMAAIERLDKVGKSAYSKAMFFVVNATSIQIIPTTVIALRIGYGSTSAYDILLPSLLTSIFCTAVGILLVRLLVKKEGE